MTGYWWQCLLFPNFTFIVKWQYFSDVVCGYNFFLCWWFLGSPGGDDWGGFPHPCFTSKLKLQVGHDMVFWH